MACPTGLKQQLLEAESRVWALKDAINVAEQELERMRAEVEAVETAKPVGARGSDCTSKIFNHIAQCVRESSEWKQRPPKAYITAEDATHTMLSRFHHSQLATFRVQKPGARKTFRQFSNPEAAAELKSILQQAPVLPNCKSVLSRPDDPCTTVHVCVSARDLPLDIDPVGHVVTDKSLTQKRQQKKTFLGTNTTKTKQGTKSTTLDIFADDIVTIIKYMPCTTDGKTLQYRWKSITVDVTPADADDESDDYVSATSASSPHSTPEQTERKVYAPQPAHAFTMWTNQLKSPTIPLLFAESDPTLPPLEDDQDDCATPEDALPTNTQQLLNN
eukprot:gene16315-24999_t